MKNWDAISNCVACTQLDHGSVPHLPLQEWITALATKKKKQPQPLIMNKYMTHFDALLLSSEE